jgi:hypothetical protein
LWKDFEKRAEFAEHEYQHHFSRLIDEEITEELLNKTQ